MLRSEKGFTLLEIIAALAILATAILALVQLISGGLNHAAQSERYLNGVYLAQQKFSQLELDNFDTDLSEGSFENLEGYYWQLEVLPYESDLNDEEARIQIQQISLRVFWEDEGREKEVRLVSLRILGETRAAPADQLGLSTTPQAPPIEKPKTPQPVRLP